MGVTVTASDAGEAVGRDESRCQRCGNPVTEREAAWVHDLDGRLRLTTVSELDTHAKDGTRIWHAGCLHSGRPRSP